MADHRSKRLNRQPSISSFLAKGTSSTPTDQDCDRKPSRSVLPSSIQSSLLNVGMRIRKAVPEGYKNKTIEEALLSTRTLSTPIREPTELQPFCGLHKTGGFASQSSNYEYVFPPSVRPVEVYDATSLSPLSSQDTVASQHVDDGDGLRALQPIAFGSSNKRALEVADEEEETILSEMDVAVSERIYARPRGKGRLKRLDDPAMTDAFAASDAVFDFGEADFLKPLHEEEMEL